MEVGTLRSVAQHHLYSDCGSRHSRNHPVEHVSNTELSAPAPKNESVKYARFRFLDLPPEVRSVVYASYLVFPYDISIRLFFPREWAQGYQQFQAQLVDSCYNEEISLASSFRFDGVKSSRDVHYPLSLDLLQTCRMVHDEAALVLYSSNTFSFDRDEAWLAFLIFQERLTNTHYLRSLHFNIPGTFFTQEKSDCGDSDISQMALTAVNALPKLSEAVFSTTTNLPWVNLAAIGRMCQSLRATKCVLVLERPWHEHYCSSYAHMHKIYRGVYNILQEYRWKVRGDFQVLDYQGPLSRACKAKCYRGFT